MPETKTIRVLKNKKKTKEDHHCQLVSTMNPSIEPKWIQPDSDLSDSDRQNNFVNYIKKHQLIFGDIIDDSGSEKGIFLIGEHGTVYDCYHPDDGMWFPKEITFKYQNVTQKYKSLIENLKECQDFISIPIRYDDQYILDKFNDELDSEFEYALDINFFEENQPETLWKMSDASNRFRNCEGVSKVEI